MRWFLFTLLKIMGYLLSFTWINSLWQLYLVLLINFENTVVTYERKTFFLLIFTVCWLAALWEKDDEESRCGTRRGTVVNRSRSTCWFSMPQALKFIVQSWGGLRQTWNVVTQKINTLKPTIFLMVLQNSIHALQKTQFVHIEESFN